MKEGMFPGSFQRAVVSCETVQERKLTASGAGFVNGIPSPVMKPSRPVIGFGLVGVREVTAVMQ